MEFFKHFTYREEQEIALSQKIPLALKELPPFITDYYNGLGNSISAKTMLSYSYDLKTFFNFLIQTIPELQNRSIVDITLNDLDHLVVTDFVKFREFVASYADPQTKIIRKNEARTITRKLATLRSLFSYLYRHDMISHNEPSKLQMPEIESTDAIRLNQNEISELLNYIETCRSELTAHQKKYYMKTVARDLAILTLLLGTDLRISECTGLNFDDLNIDNNYVLITKKGKGELMVHFGSEVHDALENYLEYRDQIEARPGHEKAIFLSMQRKRISVDAVENMVRKYATIVTPDKHVTLEKLRGLRRRTSESSTHD